VTLTKSLGRRMSEQPETWVWCDAAGSDVTVAFEKGRSKNWVLHRPEA
jgi:hypothetical protein